MSCRCDRPGWVEGHDQGCPYEEGKTPWFEETIAKLKAEVVQLRDENAFLRSEVQQRVNERDDARARLAHTDREP